MTRRLLPSAINCGIILARVVERAWVRLLIVPCRSGQAALMTVQRATGNYFVPAHTACRLICGAREETCLLLLLTCRLFRALSALIIPCEAKHVGQVFSKLPCSRKASLSDTCCPCICRCSSSLIVRSIVASINDIVLAVVKALGSVLGQYRWMRCWRCRDHRCIVGYARQMTIFG